jgi:hypothetical protein
MEREDGARIKATKSNIGRSLIPTKIPGEEFYTTDSKDLEFFLKILSKRCKALHLRDFHRDRVMHRYRMFLETAEPNDEFYERETGIRVRLKNSSFRPVNYMSINTPDRFIAKVLVEIARAFNLEKSILNLDTIRGFAIDGIGREKISFKQDLGKERIAEPAHLICITEEQFSVQLFCKYSTGIDIQWIGLPKPIYLINHIANKKVYIANLEESTLVVKEELLEVISN